MWWTADGPAALFGAAGSGGPSAEVPGADRRGQDQRLEVLGDHVDRPLGRLDPAPDHQGRRPGSDRAVPDPAARGDDHVDEAGLVLEVEEGDDGIVRANCTFLCIQYQSSEQKTFAGRQSFELEPVGDSYRILLKRVDLVNAGGTLPLITIPF